MSKRQSGDYIIAGIVALHPILWLTPPPSPPAGLYPDRALQTVGEMLSSTGILLMACALVIFNKPRAHDTGMQKHIKLLNPQPEAKRVLEMVGFSQWFEIISDRAKAIQAFGWLTDLYQNRRRSLAGPTRQFDLH